MARYAKSEKGNISISNSRVSDSSSAAFQVVIEHVSTTTKGVGSKKLPPPPPPHLQIDDIDIGIINYMLAGYSNAEVARKMGKPLSTIQRRTKNLIVEGFVIPVMHLNFKRFGLRRGILQFKCKSANLQEAVEKISAITGVESASAYLGSLDIIANVVYADSKKVLGIISEAQKLDLINDVTWAEEIHSLPI